MDESGRYGSAVFLHARGALFTFSPVLQVVTANANGCEIYYSLFAHKLNIAPSVRGVHELRVWRALETRVASDSAHGRDPCIIVVQYSLICTN